MPTCRVVSRHVEKSHLAEGTRSAHASGVADGLNASDTFTAMAEKKKKLTAEFWRKDAEQRANADRILELRRLEREQKRLADS